MAFREDDLFDHEQVVVHVHPHWYRLKWALTVPIVLLVAVIALFFIPTWPDEKVLQYTIIAIAAGLLVKYSVLPWLRWLSTRYVITTKRLVVIEGVARRSRTNIPLGPIRETGYDSGPIERLFGCGTLVVSLAVPLVGREWDDRIRLKVIELPNMPNVRGVWTTLCELVYGSGRRP